MESATINVQPIKVARLSPGPSIPTGVKVTDFKYAQINVSAAEFNLELVYSGTLDGIKIAPSISGLSSASILGTDLNKPYIYQENGKDVFRIERGATGQIDLIDPGQIQGTWYFSLRLDGVWYDPQIYNNGQPPPAPRPKA